MDLWGEASARGYERRRPDLSLAQASCTMTEQPRTVTRGLLLDVSGVVDAETMHEVDRWLRDFLALP